MEFRLPIRVYIEDTDAGGIVYYVNYLKFLERARTEFMRQLGYGKAAVGNANGMFVVSEANVKYRLPARLDDELDATATISNLGRAGMVFAQQVWRGDTLLCEGQVKIACVNATTLKPQRIPHELLRALSGVAGQAG